MVDLVFPLIQLKDIALSVIKESNKPKEAS